MNPAPPPPSPGASCLCLTYGRPHLLEEAVESFLRQDFAGPKELIVVNDHPGQQIEFDHPEVCVINLDRRLRSLGEKRNLSVALARYENLIVWDDDDISLPWRLTETMKTLPLDQYYKCPTSWCIHDGRWKDEPDYNLFHCASGYTRWLFQAARGYGYESSGEDLAIEQRFQNIGPERGRYWKHTSLPWNRIYYVYRWGHGSYHTTGRRSLSEIDPPVSPGRVVLRPAWRADYVGLALEKAKRQHA
jgi:glycosyltransferase involved in cell wall biosynthesis